MRGLVIAASVAAALGAGAVASSAQSPRDPAPALATAGCEGALPAPAAGTPATVVKFDGIAVRVRRRPVPRRVRRPGGAGRSC